MPRSRWSVPVVLGLLASGVVGFATPAAAFSQVTQSSIVSPIPATNTPDANNGVVNSITQVGNTMYMAGSFTSISNHGSSTAIAVKDIAAFDPTTGNVITGFAPNLNGVVQSITPGPAAGQIYVAGNFSSANGTATHVALLNATTGATISTWAPSGQNGVIQKVVYVPNVNNTSGNGMLFIGGSFTTVGGAAHNSLAALNPTTGKVLPYVGLSFTGHHNYNVNCSGSGCANGTIGIKDMDVDPSGTHLVAIGNFTNVSGSNRDQLALIDLGASPTGGATVDPNFQTQAYTAACFSGAFDSYVRGVTFSTDGSYFVVVATGGSGTNSDGTNSSCDTAARYETSSNDTNVRPTWIDYTGQDTLLSVAITGGVVYVGGHERWLNNSKGFDYAGPGAIARPGLAALNPLSGVPFSWNPGRSPRGAGTSALYPTSSGLWIGSDTDYIGPAKYLHKKIAFFPLAGGEPVPSETIPTLPGRVYTAGGFSNTANSNVLYRVDAGGPAIGATDNGPDWQGDQNDPSQYRNSGSNTAGWDPVPNVDNTVPASTPSAIFNTERWDPGSNGDGGEMHWAFPVPAGDQVDVRLYFANRCSCTSGTGQRVFDVAVDGQTFLDHFDIVQAVGDQTGTMRHETVTSDGQVTIDLSHETENPLINGIEIIKTGGPTNFSNPVPIYRVNSGGSQITATDSTPADWLADDSDATGTGTPFRSGGNIANWGQPWNGTEKTTGSNAVPSSVPTDLFSTERWSPHTYTFPVAPGTPVNVHLLMANNCGCTSGPGQREFNVSINGTQVLGPDYDIVGDVGDQTGEDQHFSATATNNGQVTVTLTNGSADNAVINGVEVDQTGPTPTGGSTNVDRFSYRHFDGTAAGSEQPLSTGVAWGSIRGAFMVNGELYYAKADGNLYERSFDGSTVGSEVTLDPYHDPLWDNVDTGSGQTYTGQATDLSGSASSITSMFFTNGRLYYTLKGDSVMHWRWFEPEDGVVGSDSFTVNDGNDWSNVAGAFLSGNTLYFADRNTGALSAISWNGTRATGSPTVVNSSQDWSARGLFMLADATNPNKAPVADYTASCSSTNNNCTFDATASHDPDGAITDFSWSFGDGSGEHHPDGSVFTHSFPNPGKYTVTLTATDNDGATGTKTTTVTVGQTTPVPTFGNATTACEATGATGGCGTTTAHTDVPVPSGTASGDALLMFVTWPSSPTTASAPAGWHLLGSDLNSPLESDVYYRAATASDPGTTIPVTFSAKTRNSVTLADYKGADPNSIEAFAKSGDSNTVSHTTPTAAVTTSGSLAVSYWSDKGSNTGWTLPGSVTGRATQYGAGSAGWPSAALADSGPTVPSGSYGSKTATASVSSAKGAMWTIILAPAGTTSAPPAAAFTSSCPTLHCTFDASGSTGSGLSYAWDFGDGSTGTGVSPSHDYSGSQPSYQVKLTVTDSNNATDSKTQTVTPTAPAQNIGFVGADAKDGSATSETVTTPAVSAGDTLLLFESHASTTITASAPAGWTSIGSNNAGTNLHTTVWEKTATSGDANSAVTVNFSASVKGEATIAAYHNAAASPIESISGNTSGSGTSHTTPAASGLTNGSWVVSFWTDKSTTTTAWTPPAGVTKRKDVYGTGTGAISALVADSGAAVSGSYPAQTATTNVSSGASSQWTVALSPAS